MLHPTSAEAVLAGLPRVRHRIATGARSWTIEAVCDHDALLGAADRLETFPFGLLLWESSIALAEILGRADPGHVGADVLEIGAGVGLAGLAAAAAGARVTQTDHSAEALALCGINAALNSVSGVVRRQADWRDWRDASPYEVIIGADVLYERETHALVLAILERNLRSGGHAILADPGRIDTPGFIAAARRAGWQISVEAVSVAAVAPVRSGETVAIDIIELHRV